MRPGGHGHWRNSGLAGEVRVGREALGAGRASDQRRRRQDAHSLLSQERRAVGHDQRAQLALQSICLAGDRTNARHQLQGDASACGGLLAAQATGDAIERRSVIESAGGNIGLELGAEVDEMPAQAVNLTGALRNEIGAMVGEQPNLQCALVQERGREALHALP